MMGKLARVANLFESYYRDRVRTIFFNVTNRCNSQCVYCEVHSLTGDVDLTTEEVFRLIDEMALLGIEEVRILGGEPLVRRDIWDIIEYLNERSIRLQIGTNALAVPFLGADRLAQIDRCADEVQVSLDSSDAEIHDRMRGVPAAFDRTVEGMRRLAELDHIEVSINCVVSRESYPGIASLLRFAHRLGVRNIYFVPVQVESVYPQVPEKPGKRKLLIGCDRLSDLLESISRGVEVSGELGIKTNLHYLKDWIGHYFSSVENNDFMFDKVLRDFRCVVPFYSRYIMHNGDIQACSVLPPVGNARHTGLSEQFDRLRPLKEALRAGHWPPDCRKCFCQFDINMKFSAIASPVRNRHVLRNIRKKYSPS